MDLIRPDNAHPIAMMRESTVTEDALVASVISTVRDDGPVIVDVGIMRDGGGFHLVFLLAAG